jgi:hypothetical protein
MSNVGKFGMSTDRYAQTNKVTGANTKCQHKA